MLPDRTWLISGIAAFIAFAAGFTSPGFQSFTPIASSHRSASCADENT
jgi:hypothetical protein